MQLIHLPLLAALSAAWEITVYRDINDCSPTNTQTYRVWSGSVEVGCTGFAGVAPANIQCAEYQNGGSIGPLDCTDESGNDGGLGEFYMALDVMYDGADITFYTGDNCDIVFDAPPEQTCDQAQGEAGIGGFKVTYAPASK